MSVFTRRQMILPLALPQWNILWNFLFQNPIKSFLLSANRLLLVEQPNLELSIGDIKFSCFVKTFKVSNLIPLRVYEMLVSLQLPHLLIVTEDILLGDQSNGEVFMTANFRCSCGSWERCGECLVVSGWEREGGSNGRS